MFPSIIHLQKDDVFLNHHEENSNPIVSGDSFFDTQNLVSHYHHHHQKQQQQQQLHGLKSCDDYDNLLESLVYNSSSNKKAVILKKDGHSKICTSKGPRDRRVRLSINIARKFFELQDMLGYDRPSQTIDWLFTKSKKAIAELIEETKHSSSRSSTVSATNECELAFLGTIKGISDGELKFLDGGNKKMTRKDKCGFRINLARDRLRAEARARARERTKEKLRVKGLDSDLIAKTVDGGSSSYALQSNLGGQVESQSDYDDIFQGLKLEHRFSVSSSMWHPY